MRHFLYKCNNEKSKVSYAFQTYDIPYTIQAGQFNGYTINITHDSSYNSYPIRMVTSFNTGHVWVYPTCISPNESYIVNNYTYDAPSYVRVTVLYIKIE